MAHITNSNNDILCGKILGKYLKRVFVLTWRAFITIGAVLGFFASYDALTYNISITPAVSIEDYFNPFTTFFTIKNNSYLSIRNVKFSCSPKNIKLYGYGEFRVERVEEVKGFFANSIRSGETASFVCDFEQKQKKGDKPFDVDIYSADILIIISFQTSIFRYSKEKQFRFATHRGGTDFEPLWYPKGLITN